MCLSYYQELHETLLAKRPLLATAQNSGNKLVEASEGASVEDDITTKLHPYEEAYDALLAVVADRLSKLQVMMCQSQELEVALSNIVAWLAEVEKKQKKQEAPVLRTEVVKNLQREQQVSAHCNTLG